MLTASSPPAPPSPHTQTDAQNRWIITLLAGVVFIAVVNGTMINVALPYIGHDFNVSEGTYGWLVTGYALTFGIFNAVNGRLADVIGKKRMYLIGLSALGLCSIATAFSPTIEAAIVIRLIQGAGAAALPVLGTSILKEIVAPERQGRAVGVILSTVGVAASIGPFLGGLIVQVSSWRGVFLVTGVALLALPLAWRLLPDWLNETIPQRFDWVGATLLSAGIAALLYGFELVQQRDKLTLLAALLGAGVALLLGFWAWIGRHEGPFIRREVLALPEFVACCAIGATTNAARFGSVILAPIMLINLNHLEPLQVGLVLLPGAIAITLLSTRAGAWADARGPRRPIALGLVVLALGAFVSALFAGGDPIGLTVGMTLLGAGFALAQSPLVSTVNRVVPRDQAGAGVGMFMMIFFVGGALGVAMSVAAVELQSPQTSALLNLVTGPGARFANAMLAFVPLCLLALIATWALPPSRAASAPSARRDA